MNFELAKRTKRHPLSKAQLEVLRALGDCRIRASAGVTRGEFVAGTAAAALERRGLVRRVEPSGFTPNYQITDAGRKVLARATKADS